MYEPFGENVSHLKHYQGGKWTSVKNISPYNVNYLKRQQNGFKLNQQHLVEMFKNAMILCDQSDVPILDFKFDGTYECSHVVEQEVKKGLVDEDDKVSHIQDKYKVCPDVVEMFEPLLDPTKEVLQDVDMCLKSVQEDVVNEKRKSYHDRDRECQLETIHKVIRMKDLYSQVEARLLDGHDNNNNNNNKTSDSQENNKTLKKCHHRKKSKPDKLIA